MYAQKVEGLERDHPRTVCCVTHAMGLEDRRASREQYSTSRRVFGKKDFTEKLDTVR